MDKVAFGGRTQILMDPIKYNIKKNAHSKGDLFKNQFKDHKMYDGYFRVGLSDNDFLVVAKNETNGFIVPFPFYSNDNILLHIVEKVNKLQETAKEKLTVWIIGGDSLESKRGARTIEFLNKFAELFCDKPNMDTSILVGNKTGLHENMIIEKRMNSFRMVFNSNDKIMENHFDIVELNNTEFI